MNISRRTFLKGVGAAVGLSLAGEVGRVFSKDRPFNFLVVGDSLISGQGLKDEDKFYNLTKDWLENEYFEGKRAVELKNKSHSGARLFLGEEEVEVLDANGFDPQKEFHREVNFSFPSIKTQIDTAADEYRKEGKSANEADLVLLSGSLTDIGSSYILNAFDKYGPLHKKIEEHCYKDMLRFLQHATGVFPKALFTVVSYFPMVSKKSSTGEIYNAVLELYKYPGFSKPILNNIVTKQFFKILHGRVTKRSRIFYDESSAAIKNAIQDVNELNGRESVVFVDCPIPVDRSFETKESVLWGMGKNGRSEDDLFDLRVAECKKAYKKIENLELDYKRRFCELSGLGHPNPEGSRLYADAIRNTLEKVWKENPLQT